MIISRAPVRLSMGGGGTDLASYYEKYGGFLMAAAINKFVYIMVNKRFDKTIRLSYSKTEIIDDIQKIEHNIFREALSFSNIHEGMELVSVADVPTQCGLGTSSTFTVSLLNGIYAFNEKYIDLHILAEKACHLEIDVMNQPIGKQDQYVAAFGGFNAYWFNKDGSVDIEPVNISQGDLIQLQNNILLFYLKMERSANTILKDQNDKSKEGDNNIIERLHKIKEMGLYTKKLFESGKLDEYGEVLHEHWLTKKGLSSKISDPFIDEVYEVALKNGAIGGKVVGAGGGGFLLLYCKNGGKSNLISAMSKYGLDPMWFAFHRDGAKIVFHG